MHMRIAAGLGILMAGLVLAFGTTGQATAQNEKKAKDDKAAAKGDLLTPKFLYGHDLRVRPGGKNDWIDAHKIGIEVFEDETTKTFVGISEAGALAAIPAGKVGEARTCKWITALDMKARKSGELEFTDKTKKYGAEVFRDLGSNRLLYVCETASLAFAEIPSGLVTDRGPKWHHGFEMRVRAPEQSF